MKYSASNHICWHGRTRADHDARIAKYLAAGWEPIALSVAGTPSTPSYACAMAKTGATGVEAFSALDAAGFQNTFNQMAQKQKGCFLVSATGPANAPLYAAAFRPMAAIPTTRQSMTRSAFAGFQIERRLAGERILTMDAFGDPAAPTYCGVWIPNPTRVAWNIDALDEDTATLQQRFDQMVATRSRMALVALTPAGRYCAVFADSRLGGTWQSRGDLTAAQYQAVYDGAAKQGMFPVAIGSTGQGGDVRYAVICASTDEVLPRAWQPPLGPGDPVDGIDKAMRRYMQAHNLRGASLAIVKGTRLVYAKGYTYAESDYPVLSPRSAYRQASVSKTFTATAIWRLIADNGLIKAKLPPGGFTLTTLLRDVVPLRKPDGGAAVDGWNQITIQHLLESRSGIVQWLATDRDTIVAANAMAKAQPGQGGVRLPCTPDQLLHYAVSVALTGTPGDAGNVVYGNMDYFVLGQVLAALMQTSAIGALDLLVFDPLQMSGVTSGSRTLVAAQQGSEAFYHDTVFQRHDKPDETWWELDPLLFQPSIVTDGRPLQPQQYGGGNDFELLATCGGVSAAVVDVARLYAAFSCRSDNPLFPDDWRTKMLAAAVAATQNGTYKGSKTGAHGYHGFDGAGVAGAATQDYSIGKGGWVPAMGSWAGGWTGTGGYMFVIAQNGNSYDQNRITWLSGLVDENGQNGDGGVFAAAIANPWPDTDLFHAEYGMVTLSPTPAAAPAPQPAPVKLAMPALDPAAAQRMVAVSMRRDRLPIGSRAG